METAVLTLRKKFFISDQNIDCSDPVQLHLLYVQLRDAIINGSLLCTRDESVYLAALQCQVVHGNSDKHKQKSGFLDSNKFLPGQYAKQKGIEKLIFEAHHKLFNTNEINAKFKYIQFCQSLKTYGVTFFHVKVHIYIIAIMKNLELHFYFQYQEMAQHQKKLIPCLLGITRESVMKVDCNTKAVLKTWPLSTVRRWGSSPNALTLVVIIE